MRDSAYKITTCSLNDDESKTLEHFRNLEKKRNNLPKKNMTLK
jgi:hypothetical protein